MPTKKITTQDKSKQKMVNKEKIDKLAVTKKIDANEESKKKGKFKFNLLRGMHDVLPREEKYWKPFINNAALLAEQFRFRRIDTPILEEVNLFIRSIGKGTDVVDKEMYVFEDRDKNKICLRPEMTASVVRAFISHGLWSMPQPIKLWYTGPMFRHDRPQAGRYRQFNQIGFEVFGEENPVVDAELILTAVNLYKDLGMPVEVHINSIGTPEEREKYKKALVEYYRAKRSYLCEDCKKRINKNPLRLLDCKADSCQPVKEEAPQIVEWLENSSKDHFTKVLEYLDELEISYVLDHTLVRGLDYYTQTVFELYPVTNNNGNQEQVSQGALGGGGRYDLLVEQMGGRPTPAAGFAIGVERAVSYLRECCEKEICALPKDTFDVFLAQLGGMASRRALKIVDDMRNNGIKVDFNLSKKSLKGQLDIANSCKVPFALILGQKEVQDSTIIIRDMESGVQEIVDQKKIIKTVQKKLGKVDLIGKK